MGHRLSRIYTRTGDKGTTGLAGGQRIAKDSLRVAAMGAVDELNSHLGLLLTEPLPPPLRDQLLRIQHQLFDFGAELCMPGQALVQASQVTWLEQSLDALNAALPPLKEFILPGGTRAAALCHVARAVCRRAETHCVALNSAEPLSPVALQYINRLSDFLFVAARALNQAGGQPDVLWQASWKQLPSD
jgi:cob(I)alamin adenosyltransferase